MMASMVTRDRVLLAASPRATKEVGSLARGTLMWVTEQFLVGDLEPLIGQTQGDQTRSALVRYLLLMDAQQECVHALP